MRYVVHVLLALDCLGTSIVGGWYGETLSSYAWRLDLQGKRGGRIFRPLIDWLFAWQRRPGGHCYYSWLDLKARNNMPPDMR